MSDLRDSPSVSLSEMTLLKLAESISQQTATALINVSVPQFSGALNEDIHEFLRKYKTATISLGENMKVRALQKALTGQAYTWAKNNIKQEMQEGINWRLIKKALVERFEAPNSELRFHGKLAKMQFDPTTGTLTSYLESYTECFSKVYTQAKDVDIVSALKLNLPNNIQRALNLLNDEWTKFTKMEDLFKLARRVEEKILPFEKDESSEDKLSANKLVQILDEFKKSMQSTKIDNDKPIEKKENLAAIQCDGLCQQNQALAVAYDRNFNGQNRGFNGNRNWREQGENRFKKIYHDRNERRVSTLPYPKKDYAGQFKEKEETGANKFKQIYVTNHGNPPGPCYYCTGFHFNRHCPLRDPKDLK